MRKKKIVHKGDVGKKMSAKENIVCAYNEDVAQRNILIESDVNKSFEAFNKRTPLMVYDTPWRFLEPAKKTKGFYWRKANVATSALDAQDHFNQVFILFENKKIHSKQHLLSEWFEKIYNLSFSTYKVKIYVKHLQRWLFQYGDSVDVKKLTFLLHDVDQYGDEDVATVRLEDDEALSDAEKTNVEAIKNLQESYRQTFLEANQPAVNLRRSINTNPQRLATVIYFLNDQLRKYQKTDENILLNRFLGYNSTSSKDELTKNVELGLLTKKPILSSRLPVQQYFFEIPSEATIKLEKSEEDAVVNNLLGIGQNDGAIPTKKKKFVFKEEELLKNSWVKDINEAEAFYNEAFKNNVGYTKTNTREKDIETVIFSLSIGMLFAISKPTAALPTYVSRRYQCFKKGQKDFVAELHVRLKNIAKNEYKVLCVFSITDFDSETDRKDENNSTSKTYYYQFEFKFNEYNMTELSRNLEINFTENIVVVDLPFLTPYVADLLEFNLVLNPELPYLELTPKQNAGGNKSKSNNYLTYSYTWSDIDAQFVCRAEQLLDSENITNYLKERSKSAQDAATAQVEDNILSPENTKNFFDNSTFFIKGNTVIYDAKTRALKKEALNAHGDVYHVHSIATKNKMLYKIYDEFDNALTRKSTVDLNQNRLNVDKILCVKITPKQQASRADVPNQRPVLRTFFFYQLDNDRFVPIEATLIQRGQDPDQKSSEESYRLGVTTTYAKLDLKKTLNLPIFETFENIVLYLKRYEAELYRDEARVVVTTKNTRRQTMMSIKNWFFFQFLQPDNYRTECLKLQKDLLELKKHQNFIFATLPETMQDSKNKALYALLAENLLYIPFVPDDRVNEKDEKEQEQEEIRKIQYQAYNELVLQISKEKKILNERKSQLWIQTDKKQVHLYFSDEYNIFTCMFYDQKNQESHFLEILDNSFLEQFWKLFFKISNHLFHQGFVSLDESNVTPDDIHTDILFMQNRNHRYSQNAAVQYANTLNFNSIFANKAKKYAHVSCLKCEAPILSGFEFKAQCNFCFAATDEKIVQQTKEKLEKQQSRDDGVGNSEKKIKYVPNKKHPGKMKRIF